MIKRLNLYCFEIDKKEYMKIIKNKQEHILIDVRRENEISDKKCDDKIYPFREIIYIEKDEIDKKTLEGKLLKSKLYHDKNSQIIILCRQGNRSLATTLILNKMGFVNVKSLNCGINGLET